MREISSQPASTASIKGDGGSLRALNSKVLPRYHEAFLDLKSSKVKSNRIARQMRRNSRKQRSTWGVKRDTA
jgi:hypothetical protein